MMMKQYAFLFLMLIVGPVAFANTPVCKTLDDCLQVENAVEEQLSHFRRHKKIDFEDIVFQKDKSSLLNFFESDVDCGRFHTRMLSSREFAELAMKNGAVGIRETKHFGKSMDLIVSEVKEMRSAGYYAIERLNQHGSLVIDFYYNPSGYVNNYKTSLSHMMYWTSARFQSDGAISFSFENGQFYESYILQNKIAHACVRDEDTQN